MKLDQANSRRGMTMMEVLVVIAVIVLLVVVISPTNPGSTPRKAKRINCVNNLKQIGLSFKTWGIDNGNKYPMELSVTNGGTWKLTFDGNAFIHFQVMSNELSTTKLLVCPSDETTTNATSFLGLRNKNVSYFVGIDAKTDNPKRVLAGDRDVSLNNLPVDSGLAFFPSNSLVGWSDKIHNKQGNLLYSDGSVLQYTSAKLQSALEDSGLRTNRLAIP